MIYSKSNNLKVIEGKFAVLNKMCKESKYEGHRMCTENVSAVFGRITVSRSTNFVYATGPDSVEGSRDDLIWYEGVLYAPASPGGLVQYVGPGLVFIVVMISIFIIKMKRLKTR